MSDQNRIEPDAVFLCRVPVSRCIADHQNPPGLIPHFSQFTDAESLGSRLLRQKRTAVFGKMMSAPFRLDRLPVRGRHRRQIRLFCHRIHRRLHIRKRSVLCRKRMDRAVGADAPEQRFFKTRVITLLASPQAAPGWRAPSPLLSMPRTPQVPRCYRDLSSPPPRVPAPVP